MVLIFVKVFFEPTSNHKCLKIIDKDILPNITFIKPNLSELETLVKALNGNTNQIEEMIHVLLKAGIKNVILTMGENGILHGTIEKGSYVIKQFKPEYIREIVDVCENIFWFRFHIFKCLYVNVGKWSR